MNRNSHNGGLFILYLGFLFWVGPKDSIAQENAISETVDSKIEVSDVEVAKENISSRWISFLTGSFKKIFSIQGEFSQTIRCRSKRLEAKLLGRFKLKRPGMYRWEYQTSTAVGPTMVSDGKSSVVYDRNEQVTILNQSVDSLFTSVATFLTGTSDDIFLIRYLGGASGKELLGVLQLTPKAPHPFIRSLVVTISKTQPFLKRIIVLDKAGCTIETTPSNVKINEGIKTAVFQFNLPKNTVPIEP